MMVTCFNEAFPSTAPTLKRNKAPYIGLCNDTPSHTTYTKLFGLLRGFQTLNGGQCVGRLDDALVNQG